MEYEAFTDSDEELRAGTPILVKETLGPNQVLIDIYLPSEEEADVPT